MKIRSVQHMTQGHEASDGAGVRLTRLFDPRQAAAMDPFLMLDAFRSEDSADYIAGFPPHPHRGFETVTYMIAGRMRHQDHMGNEGLLQNGGAQWMTAGRGIIHSEMPEQEEGLMFGYQLWLNLPAKDKMQPAWYRDMQPDEIPSFALPGATVRAVAGRLSVEGKAIEGLIQRDVTAPIYLDINLDADTELSLPVGAEHKVVLVRIDGDAVTGAAGTAVALREKSAAILSDGDTVRLQAGANGARLLLLAGRPIGESIAHYGPFVMNTREEIEQAMRDYQAGTLTA